MSLFSQLSARHRGTVSPQYTVANIGGVGTIVDAKGNTWQLTAGTTGGNGVLVAQIIVNGAIDTVTGNVYRLVYQGGRIWQFTVYGWYYKVLVSDAWTFASGPVAASGFIVNINDGAAIIDASANVWQITQGGQIRVNGTIDATTSSVTQLEYYGGQIWQNTASGWYKKTLPSDTWVFSASAPGTSTGVAALGFHAGLPVAGDSGSQEYYRQFYAALQEQPTVQTLFINNDESNGNGGWAASGQYQVSLMDGINTYTNSGSCRYPSLRFPMAMPGDFSGSGFTNLINGSWDFRIANSIGPLVQAGYKRIYLAPGWEMNGDWYPWSINGSNQSQFVAAFQHVSNYCHNYGNGSDIRMVWNPSSMFPGSYDYNTFYPGDQYVDVIGLDIYGPRQWPGECRHEPPLRPRIRRQQPLLSDRCVQFRHQPREKPLLPGNRVRTRRDAVSEQSGPGNRQHKRQDRIYCDLGRRDGRDLQRELEHGFQFRCRMAELCEHDQRSQQPVSRCRDGIVGVTDLARLRQY
jgi:hypothetical protein